MTVMPELVGESPGIVAIRERIARLVARASDVRRLPPVLIQGETGTGKGLVARALHRAGPRADGPFVDVNCAAIPETLLEAEMFGFERGAFTDARQAKKGLFQTAHRGTLFLDEIGLLPDGLQAKLLTVLEERTVRRLGATQSEPVDVWIITATNLDLQAATRAGRFREDLYHRLAVLTLALPPLRERRHDVVLLAEHFLARACADYGLPAKTLAPDARAALAAYRWPGNVSELINTMERVALLAEASVVTPDVLGLSDQGPSPAAGAPEVPAPRTLAAVVDGAERARVQEALAAARLEHHPRGGAAGHLPQHDPLSHGEARPAARRAGAAPPASTRPRPRRRPRRLQRWQRRIRRPRAPGIRWERRRLAILLATLASGRDVGPLDTGRVIEVLVEKARSFGGRVEELGASGFVALSGSSRSRTPCAGRRWRRSRCSGPSSGTSDGGPGPGLRIGIDLGSFLLGRLPDASLVDAEDKRDGAGRDGRAAGGCGARHGRRQRGGGALPGPGVRPVSARRRARTPGGVPARSARARGSRWRSPHALRRPWPRAGPLAEPAGGGGAGPGAGGRHRRRGGHRQVAAGRRAPPGSVRRPSASKGTVFPTRRRSRVCRSSSSSGGRAPSSRPTGRRASARSCGRRWTAPAWMRSR